MTTFSTLGQIALREIKERGRSKAYLITTVVTLLIVVGLVVVPPLLDGGPDEFMVGSLGDGNSKIIEAAQLLGTANDEPGEEPSVELTTTEFTTRSEGDAALEAGDIEALLIDGSEVVVENAGFGGSSLLRLLQRGAATVELERIVAREGQAAADVIAVMTSDPLKTTTLSGEDADDDSKTLVAYAGLMLLYVAILLYGTWILTGVTEEKSNRVVEVLLSSVRPWQLLGGKILGIGALGIAQFVGTITVALIALKVTGTFDLPELDAAIVLNLILWFVLGFLLFAVMFGAAGSLVSRMEDAQNVAFPMSLLAVVGFFVSTMALRDPTGPAAVIGTFFPLTAPFVVPVRTALEAIPPWQYVLSVIISAGAIVGLVFVAGRIYAGGLLQFGGRVGLREAWRGANE